MVDESVSSRMTRELDGWIVRLCSTTARDRLHRDWARSDWCREGMGVFMAWIEPLRPASRGINRRQDHSGTVGITRADLKVPHVSGAGLKPWN
jgi:hypothetical protein